MLHRLQRLALTRGLSAGNHKPWLILGASVWLLRRANEARRPRPEVVYRGVLAPGQTMVVDHTLTDRRGKPAKVRRRG